MSVDVEYLCKLVKKGEVERFQEVLSANRHLLDSKNRKGQTVLFCAVENDEVEMVEKLIELGSDINRQDASKSTPLIVSVCNAAQDVVDIFMKQKKLQVDIKDEEDMTALHWAVKLSNEALVENLVKHKRARIDIPNKSGVYPLHSACAEGLVSVLALFLDQHPKSWSVKDSFGNSALYYCLMKNQFECFQYLLEKTDAKALLNELNHEGMALLHLACQEEKDMFVKELIQYGSDINLPSAKGHSCLDYCAYYHGMNTLSRWIQDNGGRSLLPLSAPEPSTKSASHHQENVSETLKMNAAQELRQRKLEPLLNPLRRNKPLRKGKREGGETSGKSLGVDDETAGWIAFSGVMLLFGVILFVIYWGSMK
eukprot:Sdes_comp19485_c0_seq1m10972